MTSGQGAAAEREAADRAEFESIIVGSMAVVLGGFASLVGIGMVGGTMMAAQRRNQLRAQAQENDGGEGDGGNEGADDSNTDQDSDSEHNSTDRGGGDSSGMPVS